MTQGILDSLIASIICFALGYGFARARQQWELRVFRTIWGQLETRRRVSVVVSTRPGPHPRSTPRVSLNEMQAFVTISETLRDLGSGVIAVDGDCRLKDISGESLVLLGGPAANKVTADVWQRIQTRLPLTFDVNKFSLSVSDRVYAPQEDVTGRLSKDYALLARVSDAVGAGQQVFLCCGCHGFGTLGAAMALADKKILAHIGKKIPRKQDFCAILEMDIPQGRVSPPRLRELFVVPS